MSFARPLAVLLLIWLAIGAIAAAQRHYYTEAAGHHCAKAGTVAVTIVAGPLNYMGANPKVSCHVPQPSS